MPLSCDFVISLVPPLALLLMAATHDCGLSQGACALTQTGILAGMVMSLFALL